MIQKGAKMGAIGLEPTSPVLWAALRMWSQNTGFPKNGDRVVYAILLEVESFNNKRFLKEPWGLICNVIVNVPHQANRIILVDIL